MIVFHIFLETRIHDLSDNLFDVSAQIQEYHDVQNAKRLELIEKKKKRLDELKQFLTEQAVYDRER